MKKKNKTKMSSPLIILVGFILIVIVYFLTRLPNSSQPISSNYPIPTRAQNAKQIYKSKSLKFSIIVPSKFQIEERFTELSIRDFQGNILVDRIGTNFDNLDDYLKNLEFKNKISIIDRKSGTIEALNSIIGIVRHPIGGGDDRKSYFIFSDYAVYSISTSSPALFADLDKIAQSFRYTP